MARQRMGLAAHDQAFFTGLNQQRHHSLVVGLAWKRLGSRRGVGSIIPAPREEHLLAAHE
jgi:hypothetical protein